MNDIPYPCDTKLGFMLAHEGDGLVIQRPHKARGTVQVQTSPTILCGRGGGSGVVTKETIGQVGDKLRIRYLTPRECLRLMAFDDPTIDKLMAAIPSKTNLYKLAGNSIAVCCLEALFKGIYIDGSFKRPDPRQKSLSEFDFRGINPVVGRTEEEVERQEGESSNAE